MSAAPIQAGSSSDPICIPRVVFILGRRYPQPPSRREDRRLKVEKYRLLEGDLSSCTTKSLLMLRILTPFRMQRKLWRGSWSTLPARPLVEPCWVGHLLRVWGFSDDQTSHMDLVNLCCSIYKLHPHQHISMVSHLSPPNPNKLRSCSKERLTPIHRSN